MNLLSPLAGDAHLSSQGGLENRPHQLFPASPFLLCQPQASGRGFPLGVCAGHSPGVAPRPQPQQCAQCPHRGGDAPWRHSRLSCQPRSQKHRSEQLKSQVRWLMSWRGQEVGEGGNLERGRVAKESDPTFPPQERAINPQKKPPGAVSARPRPLENSSKRKKSATNI